MAKNVKNQDAWLPADQDCEIALRGYVAGWNRSKMGLTLSEKAGPVPNPY
jgi:hypothetical protein